MRPEIGQADRDVVNFCMAKRLAGYDWAEIEAWVWRVYLRYGLSYALEFHEWVEEAKGIWLSGLRASRTRVLVLYLAIKLASHSPLK